MPNTSRVEWDSRMLSLAEHVGGWSKDRSTRVGCVITDEDYVVLSLGFNGFPEGPTSSRQNAMSGRPSIPGLNTLERNAIYNAARTGTPLGGARMYVPWFPCMDCARAIVQTGIRGLVALVPDTAHPQWGEDFKRAIVLFRETGVRVRLFERIPSGGFSELSTSQKTEGEST